MTAQRQHVEVVAFVGALQAVHVVVAGIAAMLIVMVNCTNAVALFIKIGSSRTSLLGIFQQAGLF